MKKLFVSIGCAVAAASLAAEARAGINGTSVDLSTYYPDTSSLYGDAGSAIVGAGVEFTGVPGYQQLAFDLSDTQISICCSATFAPAAFNGFAFTFSSVVPTGATVDPASTYAPFGISLVGNTLFLNYQNVSSTAGGPSVIDLTFGSAPGGVPEPAEWALAVTGFLATGAALRRRRTLAPA